VGNFLQQAIAIIIIVSSIIITARNCEQAADEMTAVSARLMSSLSLQREAFEQQIQDSQQLVNDTADQLCAFIENERQRLLLETTSIRQNTVSELDKVTPIANNIGAVRMMACKVKVKVNVNLYRLAPLKLERTLDKRRRKVGIVTSNDSKRSSLCRQR